MTYYAIKAPDGLLWWIGEDEHRAWLAFFQYMPSRAPMATAIEAYEAIGYRCVEVNVTEAAKGGGDDAR